MKTNTLLKNCLYAITSACLASCMHYYKISSSPENTSTPDKTIQANVDLQRYFILRNGDSAYHMNNITNYKDSLTCKLETLPPEHRLHLKHGRNGKMRFKKYKPESVLLYEVHVYEKRDTAARIGKDYTLMYSQIQKIEVLEKDKGRTTTSYILGGIGYTVGVIAIIGLIAFGASLSSGWK